MLAAKLVGLFGAIGDFQLLVSFVFECECHAFRCDVNSFPA